MPSCRQWDSILMCGSRVVCAGGSSFIGIEPESRVLDSRERIPWLTVPVFGEVRRRASRYIDACQ
jgi:hypothetical protein